MTEVGSSIAAFLVGGAVALAGLLVGGSDGSADPTALVIDAGTGRDGRELVDARLRDVDAELRLPRTPAEARTNLRYFAAQHYRIVVAGPRARTAARSTGISVVPAPDLAGALAAARR
jgi:hypothetical protein